MPSVSRNRRVPQPMSRSQSSDPLLKGVRGKISIVVLILSVSLLLQQMFSSVFVAFADSAWTGVRSFAAAVFPLLVATYVGYLARLKVPSNPSQAPIINNFVIFTLWTAILLGLDGSNEFVEFPLEELLYSFTLAAMIWRYTRHKSLQALMACCYGVLCGSLGALILFGWNPIA